MSVNIDLTQSHLSEKHVKGSGVSGSKFLVSEETNESIDRIREIAKNIISKVVNDDGSLSLTSNISCEGEKGEKARILFANGKPSRIEIESISEEQIGYSAVRKAVEGDLITIGFRQDPSDIQPRGTSAMANVAPHVQGSPEMTNQLCAIYTIEEDELNSGAYTMTERTIFPGVYAPPLSDFGDCVFISEESVSGNSIKYDGDKSQISEACDKFIDENAYEAVGAMMDNGAKDCVLASPAGFVPDLKERIKNTPATSNALNHK